jgi:hypothetical protein
VAKIRRLGTVGQGERRKDTGERIRDKGERIIKEKG